jgi:hypothetical protein
VWGVWRGNFWGWGVVSMGIVVLGCKMELRIASLAAYKIV